MGQNVIKTPASLETPDPKPTIGSITEKTGRFTKLLVEFAAHIIMTKPSMIELEIDRVLKAVGEFWQMDQILLSRVLDEGRITEITHCYVAPGIPLPSPAYPDEVPWAMGRIMGGDPVIISRIADDLPGNAEADRRFFAREGIRSSLGFPCVVRGFVQCFLVFNSLRAERYWSGEVIKQVHQFGEILASALERQQTEQRIEELRQFEQLLSEVSAKYINLPVEEIEKTARNDFGNLAGLLRVDMCALHLLDEDISDWGAVPVEALIKKWLTTLSWWSGEDGNRAHLKLMRQKPELFSGLQYVFGKWSRGECHQWTYPDELPEDARELKDFAALLGIKSSLEVPFLVAGSPIGVIVVATIHTYRVWSKDLVPRLRLFGEVFANALVRKRSELALREAFSELKQHKERIEADYAYLRETIDLDNEFKDIVGASEALKQTLVKAKQVAPTDVTVLILGETGTGKGLIAQAIHNTSRRESRPLIQVNCAALVPTLIESELFGYEKGAFTGAHAKKVGRFELANGTTLFLDEIGELSLDLQAKLLQVLQDGQFQRVGGTTTIKADVRIIAATNKDLEKEVEVGRFRRDLWYRLNVFPIYVSPLRERPEDIPLFVNYFVKKYQHLVGREFVMVSQKSMNALQKYSWPGNIRELENFIERAVIASTSANLQIEIPRDSGFRHLSAKQTLAEVEKAHITRVLEEAGWVIQGPFGAARRLGLNHGTLRSRMKKLQIKRSTPARNARRNPITS